MWASNHNPPHALPIPLTPQHLSPGESSHTPLVRLGLNPHRGAKAPHGGTEGRGMGGKGGGPTRAGCESGVLRCGRNDTLTER